MLCRRHALATHDCAAGRVIPDRLTTTAHAHYLGYARRMLNAYRRGIGEPRRALHQAVRAILRDEPDCPQRRVDAFCKLLDDVSTYHRCLAGEAAELRRAVFRAAAPLHPLVEGPDAADCTTRFAATRAVAARLGRPWREIERDLFADVPDFHRLEQFAGYASAQALLSRYNVAQQQAALYDAVSMTVRAGKDFKTILRYAKLAGLMHGIVRESTGRYRFHFDGPASALRTTSRYGAAMARFLPSLIACRDWTMSAVIARRHGRPLSLDLTSADGLTSPLPAPQEFDSRVEKDFASKWTDAPRNGWTLVREGEVLCRGQQTFIPDFVFRRDDGVQALLEIVGFWTPEYLSAKVATLRAFRDTPILLAVAERNRLGLSPLPQGAIVYKSALKVKDVLDRLARIAPGGCAPQH